MEYTRRVKRNPEHIDYKAMESGRLYIRQRDGQLINASTSDASSFDRAITDYVNLFDRNTWSFDERMLIITMAYNTITLQVQDDMSQKGSQTHD